MKIVDKLLESFGYAKKEDIFKGATTDLGNDPGIESLTDQSVWAMIDSIRDISSTLENLYLEYDILSTEVIIGAALEMYADDSTQAGSSSDSMYRIVTNNSEPNKTLEKDLVAFLEKIGVESLLWTTAYHTAKYGDCFWRVYLDEDRKEIKSVEIVDHPAHVVDLFKDGERVNYGYDDTCAREGTINAAGAPHIDHHDNYSLYSPRSFVHFLVKSPDYNPTIKIVDPKKLDKNNEPEILTYKVNKGRSMLEDARPIYRIIRVLEDSMVATRIAKSEYIRIHNIEVGRDTPGPETKRMVDRVKRLFDSDQSLDIKDGYYASHKKARPFMDPIFNPVRDGKGAITTDTLGGDFDVKSIVDIDYFKNKLFAAIKIPASFLGYEENLEGRDQGDLLAQLDIRYARSIKKLITSLEEGLTDLCNIWLSVKDRQSEVGKAKVVLQASSINEEKMRMSELESRVESLTSLASSLSGEVDGINTAKLMSVLVDKYIPDREMSGHLTEVINEAQKINELNQKIAYKERLSNLIQIDEEFKEMLLAELEERIKDTTDPDEFDFDMDLDMYDIDDTTDASRE